jgi:predicted anti-sigma-YlaC factor YlaD
MIMGPLRSVMLSCREAAAMQEETTTRHGAVRKVQLWMHLRMCAACKALGQQLRQLDRLLHGRVTEPNPDTSALENRILARLRSRN